MHLRALYRYFAYLENILGKQKLPHHAANSVTGSNSAQPCRPDRFWLSNLLNQTYAVFPQSIDWSFGLVQAPLPTIVVKYVQLNWAAAGFAKISPIVKCFTRESNMNKFGEDAFFTLNGSRKGKTLEQDIQYFPKETFLL